MPARATGFPDFDQVENHNLNNDVPISFSPPSNARMAVKRKTGLTDKTAVLAAMKACRKAMAAIQMAYPSNTATYRQATHLNKELDDLALLLTGDSEALWDHPHKER